jgi:hypothetical protein
MLTKIALTLAASVMFTGGALIANYDACCCGAECECAVCVCAETGCDCDGSCCAGGCCNTGCCDK